MSNNVKLNRPDQKMTNKVRLPLHSYIDLHADSDSDDLGAMDEEIVKSEDLDNSFGDVRKRRGNLPKDSVNYLRNWLDSHRFHPYPTEEEKLVMSRDTGLSNLQICNWFINARRRILPNLLRDSGDAGSFKLKRRSKNHDQEAFERIVTSKRDILNRIGDPLSCEEEAADMNSSRSDFLSLGGIKFVKNEDGSIVTVPIQDDDESKNSLIYSAPVKPKRKYTKRKETNVAERSQEIPKEKRKYKKRQPKIPIKSDDDFGESSSHQTPATKSDQASNEYFSISRPRHSQFASTSSESRRKSIPTRIAPVPTTNYEEPESTVRVKGVIKDPSDTKCLYLIVESSNSQ